MNRRLYARIRISGAEIAAAVERDRALHRRMCAGKLTEKQQAKAWGRIRSRRMFLVYMTEMKALHADLIRGMLNEPGPLMRRLNEAS